MLFFKNKNKKTAETVHDLKAFANGKIIPITDVKMKCFLLNDGRWDCNPTIRGFDYITM